MIVHAVLENYLAFFSRMRVFNLLLLPRETQPLKQCKSDISIPFEMLTQYHHQAFAGMD